MKRNSLMLFLCLGSMLLCSAAGVRAGMSLTGSSGLLNVPTAEILPDRAMCFGFNYIPKPYAIWFSPDYSNAVYYCSMGYLPFLEVNLRITRIVRWKEYRKLMVDRMVSFRIRLTKEKTVMPAIAFGVQDAISLYKSKKSRHFNALYLVTSKTLPLPFNMKTGLHLGYSADWMKSYEHHLVGIFGGLDLRVNRYITLMAEHDTEKMNLGAHLSLISHIHLILGFLNADRFSGGINLSFKL